MTTQPDKQTISDAAELDPASLAAIRSLLQEQPVVEPQPVKERQAAKVKAAFVPLPDATPSAPLRAKTQLRTGPIVGEAAPSASETGSARAGGTKIGGAKARVFGYRPTPRHIVLAGLCLLIFFRPWLMFGVVFMFVLLVTAIFLILGYDGFWRRAMGMARWYARKRPGRAVELHRKLDGFAMKWDAVLDRFPEGSVDGLYLPDFGEMAEADARHAAALDRRFDSLRENGA